MTPPQIDDRRLPRSVEASAQWSLTTETRINTAFGGNEDRKAKRAPRWEATVTFNPSDIDDLIDLINAQIGPRWALAGHNDAELPAVDQLLEPDDDGNYPVIRAYGSGDRTRIRRIWLPIEETITVYIDGTPVSDATWTLLPNGIIAPIDSPDQGWDEADVSADFDHDIALRFADDQTTFTVLTTSVRKAQTRLIEVLG